MRLSAMICLGLALGIAGTASDGAWARDQDARRKARCANFGFVEGTDAFARCVMRLSLARKDDPAPDRETLLRRYRQSSMARRGDDRYPVCTASMMENELDVLVNKWIGPNCQMAPD